MKASRDELLAGRIVTVRDLATRIDAAMDDPPVSLLAVLTLSLLLGPGEGARLDREAARVVERATAEAPPARLRTGSGRMTSRCHSMATRAFLSRCFARSWHAGPAMSRGCWLIASPS